MSPISGWSWPRSWQGPCNRFWLEARLAAMLRSSAVRTRTRSCWGVLPGSTFVSRRSRPEHTSAAAMRSQTKLLGSTQVAGEYSLAMGSTPWQQVRVTTPSASRLCSAEPWPVLLSRGLSCLCTELRSQFCAILFVSFLARGSLGRHATSPDKNAACASPRARVIRLSA